jgi:flagellar biosynthetic protein FlhB
MSGEKTEQPTPQRLRKASREGDSGVSHYAGQALGFLVALALLPSAIGATSSRCAAWLEAAMVRASARPAPVEFDATRLGFDVVALVGPMLLATAAVVVVVGAIQTGGAVAVAKLSPDLAKLDPIAGFKRLASVDRLFSVARSLIAASAVAYLATLQLSEHAADVAHTAGRLALVPHLGGELARRLARDAAILGLVVAAVDIVVVRRGWMKRLRMSPEEVKREYKESEGDPQMKAARERARKEMLAEATVASVRDASVVVVNPTHLACALKYAEDEDGAPVVVASGEGDLAERMVRAARDYGVPIVRDVPLAQALRELQVGDVIPEALYEAVAEILRAAWEEEGKGEPKKGP